MAAAAVAPAFCILRFHPCHPFSLSHQPTKLIFHSNFRSAWRNNGVRLLGCPHAAISRQVEGMFDPELREVLDLATDSELYELESILFGPSYFSPLLKSMTQRADVDYFMVKEDPKERDEFIATLESRFLFLAADARSTLRGWRPSYRNVLLGVRKKLNIPCSSKLSTADLEVEIFLHLLRDYSSEESFSSSQKNSKASNNHDSLQLGLDKWKVEAGTALKVGAKEFRSIMLKGGGLLTIGKIYQLLAKRFSGKMFLEAVECKIKNGVIKKGVAGAAARYLGLRSVMVLLGPMMWGTFLADIVIQMLGTDYARILRAIYAFAQIRITRTYRLPSEVTEEFSI